MPAQVCGKIALKGRNVQIGWQPSLQRSLSRDGEVRSAPLGEPDEIVTAKGVGEFDIWKYYFLQDCTAQLGMSAPMTEIFFFHGNLVNFSTYPYPK